MLRSWDESGGIGVYTRNLVQELLRIDDRNQYVLLYRDAVHLGRFASHANVTERVVRAPNKALWDQIAIPYACWREKIDVLFHPKFTAPLLAPCKVVMVVHGADWFIPEQAQYYGWLDVAYIKAMMPLYFRKAAVVLSVSRLTTDAFQRVLQLPPGKIRTVYFAPARHFERITDQDTLRSVRERYSLPEAFILTLTKVGGDRRKNFGRTLEAYARYHERPEVPHKLVIGGKNCHLLRRQYGIPDDGYGRDVLFPGWIDQEDLPAVYSMADLYLYPSNLEAFPIPVVEAMACGTPLITSDRNGLQEIAGDVAIFVNPDDPNEIAQAIAQVLSDPDLQGVLSERGLTRAKEFNWEKCAHETLSILEGVAG